ncbi:MAG: hypothetical protein IKA17_07270 [Clostridia bacterium]|nr:hypothetical protein [Clostridia bacterium]
MTKKFELTEDLKRKIGALFMVGLPLGGVTKEYEEICKKYFLGNFCLDANQVTSIEKICAVTSSLRKLAKFTQNEFPFIGIDQEGGWVTRFYAGAGMMPGAMSYAASGADGDKMVQMGRRLGKILRAVGCNIDNAPSLDINMNPENPIIGTRAFGDNAAQVMNLGVNFAKGLEEEGVIAACKHFPGHGNVCGDSHLETVVNNSSVEFLTDNDFAPFKKAVDVGIGAVMTAHVTYPNISSEPATLSYEIITDLLRKKMKFDGVVITDAIRMKAINNLYPKGEAAVKAIEAGCDQVLLYSYTREYVEEPLEAVYKAVESGRITEKRLDESIERILKQKEKYKISDAEPNLKIAKKLVFDESSIAEIYDDKFRSITCIKDDGVLNNLKNKEVLCIAPDWKLHRGVEEAFEGVLSFSEIFGKAFKNATAMKMPTDEIPEIKGNYDVAVVGIFYFNSSSIQRDIINALKEKGIPIVAVLLNSPYDFKFVSDCNAVVTCYEYTELAVRALVDAMEKNEYKGILPIRISDGI